MAEDQSGVISNDLDRHRVATNTKENYRANAMPPFQAFSIQSAFSIFALGTALPFSYRKAGITEFVTAPSVAGRTTRWQLCSLVLPLITAFVLLWAVSTSRLGFAAAMAILVVLTVVPLAALILRNARAATAVKAAQRAQAQADETKLVLEERQRSVFDHLDTGFCIIEMAFNPAGKPLDYRFVAVNSAFEGQTGIVNATGRWMREIAPDHEQHWFDIYGRVAQTGEAIRFEHVAAALERYYDVYAFRVDAAEKHQVAILFSEVTARIQAEARLRLSEKRLRALVTAASSVIYRMSPDWTEMRQLDGQGFLVDTGSPSENWLSEYIHPDDQPHVWDAIQAAIRAKSMFELEHRVRRADGSLGWTHSRAIPLLDAEGNIEEWFGAASDVTARKSVEEALAASERRLAEAARMEALGRLAGGMAHDFNNTLQAVQSRLHLANSRLESAPGDAQMHIARAIEATARAVAVTSRLLTFARHSELHGESIAPRDLLTSLAEMLRHTLGADLILRVEADGALPALYADRAQLESVMINLANNARDAMPRGGMLVLCATALSSSAEAVPLELAAGAFIRLSVIDQGEGMPPELIAHVTEPFFTTKPKGKGTGLGLAMARGFAEQSGGTLTIESMLGSGTTVSLWLPQARNTDPVPTANIIAPVTVIAAPSSGTAFTVLLAEDQPEVREVLALHLEDHGFIITEAEHAAAALDLFDNGFRPDAVVTDFSMPGELDGIGLIQEARERWPCLPAVLVTGDTGVTIPEKLKALEHEGAFLLLRKPVSAKILVDCLTRVLVDNP